MDADNAPSIRDVKMEDAASAKAKDSADSSSAGASKNESAATGEAAKGKRYRSWKKKFQKMRVEFDVSIDINEKLHTEETNALQTTKRLGIEIDRILDLLLDINNTPQIPGSKRIDLSLPRSKNTKALDIDVDGGWERRYFDKKDPDGPLPEPPARSLKSLLAEVPHLDLAETKKNDPAALKDLIATNENRLAFVVPDLRLLNKQNRQPSTDLSNVFPESFLTADDIDNYLWDSDRHIAGRALLAGENPPPMIPTMAPFAHTPDTHIAHIGKGDTAWDELFNRSIVESDLPKMVNTAPFWYLSTTIARNPTSVYNWLKDHAPKAIFLQEGEATAQAAAAAAAEKEREKDKDKDDHGSQKGTGAGGKAKRQPVRKSAAVSYFSYYPSDASRAKRAAAAADADLSDDAGTTAAASSGRGGKRKRTLDDDTGYRPKEAGGGGSASARANKRKRKSESGAAGDDDNDATVADVSMVSVTKKRPRKNAALEAATADGDTEVEAGSNVGDAAEDDADAGAADTASAAVDHEASPVDA
ncbi:hypothetical protein HMPREF1624_01310 [Sporothrix schenckii ATCC 58251]|uniref:Uncharacterized protein n=1 Tax=Sporothrix schenckii (strain ATCC 58251 / de Perez 2211183) TaxID=1391915 RepID=U7Q8C9_SPOS1|nr:hypothetical protein HMPREF1624_01310 [Sporothrix schenckii ATCC 58251]